MSGPEWRDLLDVVQRVEDQVTRIEDKLDVRLAKVEWRVAVAAGFLAAGEVALTVFLAIRF